MQKRFALFIPALLLLAACASDPVSQFPIAGGPLKSGETAFNTYGQVGLSSRVFDVVSQDTTSASNTGIAGPVTPMPVDILSSYAASKFRATGGNFTTRFVVKQASLSVRPVAAATKSGWFDMGGESKVEMTVDLNVQLMATNADGTGSAINATTTQTDLVPAMGSPEQNRAAYLQLMSRAVGAIDGELSRQLTAYFGTVISR